MDKLIGHLQELDEPVVSLYQRDEHWYYMSLRLYSEHDLYLMFKVSLHNTSLYINGQISITMLIALSSDIGVYINDEILGLTLVERVRILHALKEMVNNSIVERNPYFLSQYKHESVEKVKKFITNKIKTGQA